jgi:prepilin-type N-terminal cleavage/methylation domain-containing protein
MVGKLKKQKGFTLIELLVVISIVALLLAILGPSLRKVKENARDVICRSNLRQWGVIWKMYAEMYDDKLPDCTGWGALRGDWIIALRDDYPTGKITKCPSATEFVDYSDPSENHGGVFSTYRNAYADGTEDFCSYGMNCWSYSTSHWAMGSDAAEKIWGRFEVKGTSTIPLFMDSIYRGGFPEYGGYDPVNMPAEEYPDNGFDHVYDGIRQFAMPRHGSGGNAGTNVLFFDLGARHVDVKEMWTLKWHRNFDTYEYLSKRNIIWPGTWMDRFDDP